MKDIKQICVIIPAKDYYEMKTIASNQSLKFSDMVRKAIKEMIKVNEVSK